MARTIVGVLRGGTSSEYPLSLKTGAAMMAALPEERYESRDILIDKTGTWHLRGMPADPHRALSQVDVVLNALHGGIGEDGTVQRILDRTGIPYAGSRAFSAGLSLNKVRARDVLRGAGILMPRAVSFSLQNRMDTGDMANAVFSQFGPPYIVKPPSEGSSHGIVYVPTLLELANAIADVLDAYGGALVEEYVMGDHATVGIIEHFRSEPLYILPPVHIQLDAELWYFDLRGELEMNTKYSVPSAFSHSTKAQIADIARRAHQALKLSHFSDADFVITKRNIYLLELNASPMLHDQAPFPKMLTAVGSSLREFLEHSIALARQ